ncbi:MAG: glycine--tRNA ligase, partial [Patescibacteria group bacterium]
LMSPKVWEASGHLENFSAPLVDCTSCKRRFRADHLLVTKGIKTDIGTMKEPPKDASTCPECGGKLTQERKFNLMFKTFVGPVEDATSTAYLRPETAQAIFVDFNSVVDSMRVGFPFGIAQIGKAFRNEITPGNFIFRTREFEQMEIEYFIREQEWKKQFDLWLDDIQEWITSLGIGRKDYELREHKKDELAHYSKRTVDIEYHFPFGTEELHGLAYRTDFDLRQHTDKSGQRITYTDPVTHEQFIPHVIEPSVGVERTLLAVLCSVYHEEEAPTAEKGVTEKRVVLRLPKDLAPYQVAVLPLSKKEELMKVAGPIASELRQHFVVDYDVTQSIGRRYRRQDEIGTPYCITVDFDSLNDKRVTVRDRDSMKQERVAVAELTIYLKEKF